MTCCYTFKMVYHIRKACSQPEGVITCRNLLHRWVSMLEKCEILNREPCLILLVVYTIGNAVILEYYMNRWTILTGLYRNTTAKSMKKE